MPFLNFLVVRTEPEIQYWL